MSGRTKALFAALAASVCLSACVSSDPQASLGGRGGGGAVSGFSAPMPLAPQRVSAAMPGDPLFDTEKAERGGVTPMAVLNRPPARAVASVSRPVDRSSTLAARPQDSAKNRPLGMATLSAGPTPAMARTASADDDVTATMRAALVKPALTPLSDVEARAAVEQRAQTLRDKRFDTQVRHASSIVCSGCLQTSGRRRAPAEDDVPAE